MDDGVEGQWKILHLGLPGALSDLTKSYTGDLLPQIIQPHYFHSFLRVCLCVSMRLYDKDAARKSLSTEEACTLYLLFKTCYPIKGTHQHHNEHRQLCRLPTCENELLDVQIKQRIKTWIIVSGSSWQGQDGWSSRAEEASIWLTASTTTPVPPSQYEATLGVKFAGQPSAVKLAQSIAMALTTTDHHVV